MINSGGQQRDSIIHIQVSILPQTPLLSRLPCNIELSSLGYTVCSCWLSILNVGMVLTQSTVVYLTSEST